jgi:hypothetical protein
MRYMRDAYSAGWFARDAEIAALRARVEILRAHEMAMSNYLEHGGFFNPELMDHQKVSGVILRARDAIREALR